MGAPTTRSADLESVVENSEGPIDLTLTLMTDLELPEEEKDRNALLATIIKKAQGTLTELDLGNLRKFIQIDSLCGDTVHFMAISRERSGEERESTLLLNLLRKAETAASELWQSSHPSRRSGSTSDDCLSENGSTSD